MSPSGFMLPYFKFPFPALAFPVVGMVGIACACAVYSSIHDIATNPDVRFNKALKEDEMAELPQYIDRAEGYCKNGVWSSIYAKIGGSYNTSAKSTFVSYGRN